MAAHDYMQVHENHGKKLVLSFARGFYLLFINGEVFEKFFALCRYVGVSWTANLV